MMITVIRTMTMAKQLAATIMNLGMMIARKRNDNFNDDDSDSDFNM